MPAAGGQKSWKDNFDTIYKADFYTFAFMILVTGGTGLVGSHLLWHLLQAGAKVRATYRRGTDPGQVKEVFRYYEDHPADSLFSAIEWFPADMLDFCSLDEAMRGISHVYHCAAIVSFDPSRRKQLIRGNIESTASVVNLCLEHDIKKLCHVSSVSALGTRHDGQPVTEQDNWKPSKKRSSYSVSKFQSEMEVWRGIAEGLDAVIVNPSVILGPGNWKRGSAGFFTAIEKGMKYYTRGMTGFVDVRDVCRCMIRLMDSDIGGERFILNSDDLYYRDLFNMIAGELGLPGPTIHASEKLVEAGWRLEWLRSKLTFSKPMLTRETARSGRGVSRYSNQKIKEATGHEFIPIKETIRWTASKFKQRNS
jgi:dihydroflavonol-4-reductase